MNNIPDYHRFARVEMSVTSDLFVTSQMPETAGKGAKAYE